jgi:hypothetical protein
MSQGRRRRNLVAVGVVLATVVAACAPIAGSGSPGSSLDDLAAESGHPNGSGVADRSSRPDAVFPTTVAGMPVITVARATELLGAGELEGRAIAVAGYFGQFIPACPYPGRYIGPLESWCMFVAFADTSGAARLCHPEGSNGTSCSMPTATHLQPFFMSETSGDPWSLVGNAAQQPVPLVVVGHSGDARWLQCPSTSRAECRQAFVVDRIAWANGTPVPLAAGQIVNQQGGPANSATMSLGEVQSAAALTGSVVAAGPVRAGDIAFLDPRWNLAGNSTMWLVRTLATDAMTSADGTRAETVWLVDDATGKVTDSRPAAVDPAYQPAQLWRTATANGVECCGTTSTMAFDRIQADDGTVVYEGLVSGGSSGGDGYTTFGGGYGSQLLVLPAGGYTIRTWLAPYSNGVMGDPQQACETHMTLKPLDSVTVDADFPAGQPCTSGPAPVPTPMF